MKKTTNKIVCTPRQRVWGILAFFGLFVCGVMIGFGLNDHVAKKTVKEEVVVVAPQPVCVTTENILKEQLAPAESDLYADHMQNVFVYEKLWKFGCPENASKHRNAMIDEEQIAKALKEPEIETLDAEDAACEQVEAYWMGMLPSVYEYTRAEERIDRAKIYSILAERGCSENSSGFADMAAKELQIARALKETFFDEEETIEVVETYKRLGLQQAATEILETAKKLTNPAIDFILEVEKIINEQ